MAFDPLPPTWIPGWSEDGTNIIIPLASLPEITAAEADATTGDIRKSLYALCEHLRDTWDTMASADRPSKMVISATATINPTTNEITKRYTFAFTAEASGIDVAAE